MLSCIMMMGNWKLWLIIMEHWKIRILLISILWRRVRRLRRGFVVTIWRYFIWIIMGIVIRILLCIVSQKLVWPICSSTEAMIKVNSKLNTELVWELA